MIGPFTGEYRWLSNFWPAPVRLESGLLYPTVEHAYVAAKTLDCEMRQRVALCPTPGDAKRMGRTLPLRPDWDKVKLAVMESLLRQKFNIPTLKKALINTHPHELVEVNTWKDRFWGQCNGVGENHLGRLLMKIRAELINDHADSPLDHNPPTIQTYSISDND